MKKRTRKNNKKVDTLIVVKIKKAKHEIMDMSFEDKLVSYLDTFIPNSKSIVVFEDVADVEIYSKKWRKLKLKELNINIWEC